MQWRRQRTLLAPYCGLSHDAFSSPLQDRASISIDNGTARFGRPIWTCVLLKSLRRLWCWLIMLNIPQYFLTKHTEAFIFGLLTIRKY